MTGEAGDQVGTVRGTSFHSPPPDLAPSQFSYQLARTVELFAVTSKIEQWRTGVKGPGCGGHFSEFRMKCGQFYIGTHRHMAIQVIPIHDMSIYFHWSVVPWIHQVFKPSRTKWLSALATDKDDPFSSVFFGEVCPRLESIHRVGYHVGSFFLGCICITLALGTFFSSSFALCQSSRANRRHLSGRIPTQVTSLPKLTITWSES